MEKELKQELIRYGIVFKGYIQKTIIINDKEYEIPEQLQEFSGALDKKSLKEGPHIFYDRYSEGEKVDYNTLYFTKDEVALEEYEFYGNTPFVLFARNGQYSLYLLRIDDENPENPIVYYLGVDDYDENPHALTNRVGEILRLMEFLKISSPIGK